MVEEKIMFNELLLVERETREDPEIMRKVHNDPEVRRLVAAIDNDENLSDEDKQVKKSSVITQKYNELTGRIRRIKHQYDGDDSMYQQGWNEDTHGHRRTGSLDKLRYLARFIPGVAPIDDLARDMERGFQSGEDFVKGLPSNKDR